MNHLSQASSPYLRQHISNPVEWYPWCEEAFARARTEQKPIFLSIGYSTCHWCHVMAHESFEHPAIAAFLNEHFLSIKLDREERPDVDRLYMSYVQALTGSGGWPLSVWLTPELKPFFGGTYFPPESREGRVGFLSVLQQLAQLWRENRPRLEREAVRAVATLEHLARRDQDAALIEKTSILENAYRQWYRSFDATWGGFGGAPKFPRPSILLFLLRYASTAAVTERVKSQEMALMTLRKMATGGLQDHLGGGFHRYSVDRLWQVPHFEKMLYDQAQLAMAYLEAFQLTGEKFYQETLQTLLDYVLNDMTHPQGGFYAAEDADSPDIAGIKKEGAFYVWSLSEIEKLLSPEEARLVIAYYKITEEGNIPEESDPHGELLGKNSLMIWKETSLVAEELRLEKIAFEKILAKAQGKLLLARHQRSRPERDDKIVTAWNGLMISAYARAGATLGSQKYLEAAVKAAFFLKDHLYHDETQELFRSSCNEVSSGKGFAEDYAFLIQGLLDLYEATFEIEWLAWAETLQKKMDELFCDEEQGSYFSSAVGDPHLLLRMKEEYDGAEPSANSVATLNLLRFSRMLQDQKAAEQAERMMQASAVTLEGMPTAMPHMLVALWYSLRPASQIVIAGDLEKKETQQLIAKAREGFHPEHVLMLADGKEGQEWLGARNPTMKETKLLKKGTQAALYQCHDFICEAPFTLDANSG